MIQEQMRLVDELPGIHLHTMYSLGLDTRNL